MNNADGTMDWVGTQNELLEELLNIPEIVLKLHDTIMSGGKYRDWLDHEMIVGGHYAIGRLRQCERAALTIFAKYYQGINSDLDPVKKMLFDSAFNSAKIRFDPHSRYDIFLEYGFLVTKWTASPTMLQFEENEELRRLVYLSDGILDMKDLRRYIEHEHPWIMAECAARKGRAFIEPIRCVSDDETAIGWLSPDAKNLFTLLESHRQLCAILSMPIWEQRVSELEDALRECLELAWGRGGTYAVRKGYRVVLV
jgi:hypothetical protein